MLPNFIIGGIMKSGTTYLKTLLSKHHQVQFLKRKMGFSFFDDDRVYKNGLEWYEKLFEDFENVESDIIVGQASADSAFNPNSIERILQAIPDVKLIFVVRHPIDRAYSLYWHQYGMGREHLTFEEAINSEKKRIEKSYYNFKMYSYIERSRYDEQFKKVLKLVPEKNLLILPFDALIKNTLPTLNHILEFLQVEKIESLDVLDLKTVKTNAATIPSNVLYVKASFALQKIGLVGAGRRLLNMTNEQKRPPLINENIQKRLETELKKDILFFEKIKKDFYNRLESQE